jgi:hypothetical protein
MADELTGTTNTENGLGQEVVVEKHPLDTTDVDKGEGGDPAKVKDGEPDKTKTDSAPDSYTDFKFADGLEADKDVTGEFKQVAKELNLSQDKAQKLVDLQNKLMQNQGKRLQESWENTQNDWKKATTEDKEIGGPKLQESLASAKKVLEKFGTPALNKIVEEYGMGNNVEFIRLLTKVGNTIKEDSMNTGGSGTQSEKDPAKILFPNMA